MKLPKEIMAGGAIMQGALIVLSTILGWPAEIYYVWAFLAFAWGIIVLTEK